MGVSPPRRGTAPAPHFSYFPSLKKAVRLKNTKNTIIKNHGIQPTSQYSAPHVRKAADRLRDAIEQFTHSISYPSSVGSIHSVAIHSVASSVLAWLEEVLLECPPPFVHSVHPTALQHLRQC